MAVVVDPERGWAWSSTRNTRSASPSKASPTSAPTSSTRAWRSLRFSGWMGSGGWLGKEPSSSAYISSTSKGRPVKTSGATSPPMPLPASATTLRGRSTPRSTNERTWSPNSPSRSREETEPAAGVGRASSEASAQGLLDHGLDLLQAGVLAHRLGPRQAQLDPVVLGRVVGRGEHRPGRVEAAGGVVDEVGGDEAEVDDIGPLAGGALGEGGRELHAGGPHVASHEDAGGAGEAGEGGTHGPGDGRVELVGDHAPDVVRLENLGQIQPHRSVRLCAATAGTSPPQ